MQETLNSIKELIEKEYKNNLLTRYENIKQTLEDENFEPEPEEVWKLNEKAFNENKVVYSFVSQLLNIDACDENRKRNNYDVYLDDINQKTISYCMAYVIGKVIENKKAENNNTEEY